MIGANAAGRARVGSRCQGRAEARPLQLRLSGEPTDLPAELPVRHRWSGIDAGVYAYGYADGRTWWMRWPNVGTFRMDPDAGEVVVAPEPGASTGVLQDAFRRGVTPVALLQRGMEVLHASAVHVDGRVIALCAASGTGKSTLAAALRSTTTHWADDFVAWTIESNGVRCEWFPSAPRLSTAAATALDRHSQADCPARTLAQAPLGAVLILERGEPQSGGVASMDAVPASDAFTAVLAHAHECGLGGVSRTRASVARYLDFAARVPVYRLVFRPDLGRLQELTQHVDAQLRTVLR